MNTMNTVVTNILPIGVFIFVILAIIFVIIQSGYGNAFNNLKLKDFDKTTGSLAFGVFILLPVTIAGIVYIALKFS
jgi:hypothetical protein